MGLPSIDQKADKFSLLKTIMQKQGLAYLYAAVSVLLWSSVATVFKLALNDLPVIVVPLYCCRSTGVLLERWSKRLGGDSGEPIDEFPN